MSRLFLAFLAAPFIILQSASEVLPSSSLNMQAEEYAVYSVMLDSLESDREGKTFFVIDQTCASFDLAYLLEDYRRQEEPYLFASTLLDFRRKQVQRAQLSNELTTKHRYQLFNIQDYHDVFKSGCLSWCDFYKQYENSSGIVRFSRVGFSLDGAQALVYFGYGCGGLCGHGGYMVLRKQDGVWNFEKGMVVRES